MPPVSDPTVPWGFIIFSLFAVVVLLPIIISNMQYRSVLSLAATLFSLLSAGGFIAALFSGLYSMAMASLAGVLWLGALACGIAALLDAAAERRQSDLAWRLLHNDIRGLRRPAGLPAQPKNTNRDPEQFSGR